MVVNVQRPGRNFRARISSFLRLLWILLGDSLKFQQLRRQICQESVPLEALVELAHPLIENIEGLLLFLLDEGAPRTLARQ